MPVGRGGAESEKPEPGSSCLRTPPAKSAPSFFCQPWLGGQVVGILPNCFVLVSLSSLLLFQVVDFAIGCKVPFYGIKRSRPLNTKLFCAQRTRFYSRGPTFFVLFCKTN